MTKVGIVVVLLCAACSSVGSDGTGGSQGGAGGGAEPVRFDFPSCWQELTADCPISAICYKSVLPGWEVGECMADATRLDIASVRKRDGTLCYTLEAKFVFSGTCASASDRWNDPDELVWKNPAGEVVATGSTTANSLTIACPGGAVQSCTLTDPAPRYEVPSCPAYYYFCTGDDP